MFNNLIDHIEIRPGASNLLIGGGNTGLNGIPVNMAACDGCLFILWGTTAFGQEATTHMWFYLKGSQTSSTQAASTAYSRIGSSAVSSIKTTAVGAANAANRDRMVMAIDYAKPQFKFVKACVQEATGKFDFIAIKYNLRGPGNTEWRDSTFLGPTTRLIGTT